MPKNSRFDIYILVNDKLERDFEVVPNGTIDVASRTLGSITKAQTRAIVLSTYEFARQNRVGSTCPRSRATIPRPTRKASTLPICARSTSMATRKRPAATPGRRHRRNESAMRLFASRLQYLQE
jgi:hypothetical protein